MHHRYFMRGASIPQKLASRISRSAAKNQPEHPAAHERPAAFPKYTPGRKRRAYSSAMSNSIVTETSYAIATPSSSNGRRSASIVFFKNQVSSSITNVRL